MTNSNSAPDDIEMNFISISGLYETNSVHSRKKIFAIDL